MGRSGATAVANCAVEHAHGEHRSSSLSTKKPLRLASLGGSWPPSLLSPWEPRWPGAVASLCGYCVPA